MSPNGTFPMQLVPARVLLNYKTNSHLKDEIKSTLACLVANSTSIKIKCLLAFNDCSNMSANCFQAGHE